MPVCFCCYLASMLTCDYRGSWKFHIQGFWYFMLWKLKVSVSGISFLTLGIELELSGFSVFDWLIYHHVDKRERKCWKCTVDGCCSVWPIKVQDFTTLTKLLIVSCRFGNWVFQVYTVTVSISDGQDRLRFMWNSCLIMVNWIVFIFRECPLLIWLWNACIWPDMYQDNSLLPISMIFVCLNRYSCKQYWLVIFALFPCPPSQLVLISQYDLPPQYSN